MPPSSSNSPKPPIIFPLLTTLFLLSATAAQPFPECSDRFKNMITSHGQAQYCRKLTTLKAEFGWAIRRNKTAATSVDVFFGAPLDKEEGWLAWGVNPGKRPQMIGTRAMVGIKYWNGSFGVETYNITSDIKLGCRLRPSKLDDDHVSFTKLTISNDTDFVMISATVNLPSDYNISKLHHVWQVGDQATWNEPRKHPTNLQNVDSTESINLWTGNGRSVGHHRRHLRMVHGILNIVGWGTLLPLGVILARYFRQFPIRWKYWFVAHVNIQIVGYTLGTIGWVIGLVLGHSSRYYTFRIHRILAIFIFTFTTLQMLALRLKPDVSDEYRKYWDMYHHFLGYALLALISVNIFQGIAILKPDQTWKWAYVGVLGALAAITLFFEICTWFKFIWQQKKERDIKRQSVLPGGSTGAAGGSAGGGGGGGPPDRGGGPPDGGSGGGGPPSELLSAGAGAK